MLYKLKYINERGESIEFKGNQYDFQEPTEFKNKTTNPFNLIRFESFGEVGANVQLQKAPFQDGSTHLDTVLQERTPYLEFVIVADNWNSLSKYRKQVSSVFNPKINGRFELSFDNKTYVLDSIPESVPHFADEDTVGRSQIVSINFVSPNPYWEDETDNKKSLIAYRNGLRYPFSFPKSYGIEGHSVVIVNEGHVDTPMTIEFFGPSLNPTLTNETTGEFIKVYRQLRRGEKLTLNTDFNRKRVEITRKDGTVQNAYGYVDWFESSFIKLIPGINVLKYTADSGTEEAVVNIIYRNRYVGI